MTERQTGDHRQQEFSAVRAALNAAGLPSADFGRFTSGRHPEVVRPEVFDYRRAVPVLIAMMNRVSHPDVLESIVRSLSTSFARPVAAAPLMALFASHTAAEHNGLKWAIGSALATVATADHKQDLLALALEPKHGTGRQMIVERLGRISGDARILEALRGLATDPDVALHAQAGLRRQLGNDAAVPIIRQLLDHPSEGVRRAAAYNVRQSARAQRRKIRNGT